MHVGRLQSAPHVCGIFLRILWLALPTEVFSDFEDPFQSWRRTCTLTRPDAFGLSGLKQVPLRIPAVAGGGAAPSEPVPRGWAPTLSVGALLGTALPKEYLLGHFLSIKTAGALVMTQRTAVC